MFYDSNLSALGWIYFVLFCIAFIVGIIYSIVFLLKEFKKCNNDDVQEVYHDDKYIIFYNNGRKLIRTYHLTSSQNKQVNDTLNRSPLVKSYKVNEL